MRVIFMGTPDFSVGTLEALIEAGHEDCAGSNTAGQAEEDVVRRCSTLR